jgi:hypothetical protein
MDHMQDKVLSSDAFHFLNGWPSYSDNVERSEKVCVLRSKQLTATARQIDSQ